MSPGSSACTLCLWSQQLDLSLGHLHIRKDVLKGVAKDFDGEGCDEGWAGEGKEEGHKRNKYLSRA